MTDKLTLSELQLMIRDTLYVSLPEMYWVVAEISEAKETIAGHCYLELIEKHPDDSNVKARVKAIIWNSRYGFIKSFFENITGGELTEGLKILVKAKIEYHELYGLSLVISDIDPSYTIGEMAVKRQMIIRQLEEDGIFYMNKEIDFPALPKKIAVISSKNAAGYTDFISQLTENAQGYVFNTMLIESAMQGAETEQGIIDALDKIAENQHLFDVVVIIRGGGSQYDLSWFDNYNIAYHITQFPLPILTGIGHDKDMSVTDMVACRALKTPTAVAEFLINSMYETESNLLEIGSEIKDITSSIIETFNKEIEAAKVRIVPLTTVMIAENRKWLSGKITGIIRISNEYATKAGITCSNNALKLKSSVKYFVSSQKDTINHKQNKLTDNISKLVLSKKDSINKLEKSLNVLNPDNVLQRGYSITLLNGKVLKSTKNVKDNDLIDTKISDGTISSRVFKKH